MNHSEYAILAPNLWNELFKMFELDEIMRQRESKEFAEMLNRLREGKHTEQDIVNLKQRMIEANNSNYPLDAPHLFTENEKVNKFNDRAHHSMSGTKYTIKAHDSVIGATSTEQRDKIMKQIPNLEPKNTKQLHYNLNLAVEERTEISLNTRIDDGMTNGASNVIKLIQLHAPDRPSGVIWVKFDHADVGRKTRHDNRQLYTQGIEPTWTPIKPVTAVFAVAKTINRSQGDTETRVVVNFGTRRRAIPHMHYVGLSRVTTTERLYITELCEDKITVSSEVEKHMKYLRTEGKLELCISPVYNAHERAIKVCFLNARSLHKHIDDVRADLNYLKTDINIFF